ncbi:MAG: N-6 DNA methylase [Deltaproteobacteria bacterium]|nr:N-6 DNA methylase [Deltaproteobacteria bacterium]
MVQPSEGLVVSVPVLVEAQVMERQDKGAQEKLKGVVTEHPEHGAVATDLAELFEQVLDLSRDRFDSGDALPDALQLYVPEGQQTLRPTMALRKNRLDTEAPAGADVTEAAIAGHPYLALVWEVPCGLNLDKPETQTGSWDYPAQAKFDRLLRECRVPIGFLFNGKQLRLTYAPHGESSGWIAFRIEDMTTVGGRPILDAFVMLLSRAGIFGVAPERQLSSLLKQSRLKQAEVTNELAKQVFEALEILLAGFVAASERDGDALLRDALQRDDDHLYAGLLTVLLRLVFILYCEDKGLFPTEHPLFARNFSLFHLFELLQKDNGRYPDSMARRFGAYAHLVSVFRAVFLGVAHGDFFMPPRRGELFDPNLYPFLEGWGPAGSAPISQAENRSLIKVPSVDDGTVFRVLEKLVVLGGQRLSYRALDVEQIGSVYEALMGFSIQRLEHDAVRIRLSNKKNAARMWVQAGGLLELAANRRASYIQDDLGFDKGTADKIAKAIKDAKDNAAALTALEPLSGRSAERASAGTLVVQPGLERRRTSSHYTPRDLSDPIVERTLRPLIKTMGEAPSSESLLNLVICDPAMGSGAFLVAACRYLADHVVAAWTREGKRELIADAHEDVVNHARRLVAQRCLYGVDKNRYAVQLARLSLWLITMARNEPFTFVDHALRHGDSLVGLDFDQIRSFHWEKKGQLETCRQALSEALEEAIDLRKQIIDLAYQGTVEAQREKERLLLDAEDASNRVRLLGDLVIGAFFKADKDKARQAERDQRLKLVEKWLADDDEVEPELRAMQQELCETQVPFHWMVEFPEVFYLERPDPLDEDRVKGAAYVDAFVGNPPFMGVAYMTKEIGENIVPWLQMLHPGTTGKFDLCAHFFRRADSLLGDHGTVGLIATNTIGQGDTRATGLQYLVNRHYQIYAAIRNKVWPGDAAVTVSVVHLAKGTPSIGRAVSLDDEVVQAINSRLRPKEERPDPVALTANADSSFVGSYVLGMGFTFEDANSDATPISEMKRLIGKDQRNAERIFPYLGGEEVNTNPTQSHHRYVISFGDISLSDAEKWPDLISIIRTKVKPERDKVRRDAHRINWWHYADKRPALYQAIAPLSRCLVNSQVSKHLIFAFQPTNRIFAHTLYVYPIEAHTAFAVLQSRVHEFWARLLSSSMKTDLRYAASDCFETFPFPQPDPRSVIPELETIGERLYQARAEYMVQTDQGLTKTYNALKDPNCDEPRILELRELHEEMDRAVLAAYGWSDIPVPPYCIRTESDQKALQAYEDEVIDRLFVLNEKRAEQEELQGLRSAKNKKGKTQTKKKAGKKKVTGQGEFNF